MSQQEKQQIELEDDNSSIEDDDFVRLDGQTTPNNKVVQLRQQHSLEQSLREIDELKLKVAALEVFVN
jgi:hypothetical protein